MDMVNLQQITKIKSKIQQFITLTRNDQSSHKRIDRKMSISRRTDSFNNYISKSSPMMNKPKKPKSPKKKGSKILMMHPHQRTNKSKKQIQIERKQKSLTNLSKQLKTQNSFVYELMNSDIISLKKRQDPNQRQRQKQIKIQEMYDSKGQSDVFSFDQTHSLIKQIYKAVPQIIPKAINNKKNERTFVVQAQQQTVKPSSIFKKANFQSNNFLSKTQSHITPPKQNRQKQKQKNHIIRQENSQNFYQNQKINRDRNLRQSLTSLVKPNAQNDEQNRNKSLSWNQIKKQQKFKNEKNIQLSMGINHHSSSKKLSQSQYSSNFKSKKTYKNYKSPMVSPNKSKKQQISLSPQQRLKYKTTRQTNYLINKFSSKPVQKDNFKSPNQKHENLSKKYSNLDKRLSNLLQKVKEQKKGQTPSTQYLQNKTQICDQLLIYQKYSPLKKLLKVNKQLRLKFEENQKDRLYFQ